MEESQSQSLEQIHLEANKALRKALAFAHYALTHQTRFIHEQFVDADNAVRALAAVCEDLQEKIEKVEKPQPKEEAAPQKPYVVDVKMPSPEANA